MMTANETRDSFLQFFKERGHEIVPSAPLIPRNDPTLLFTNAGMNQFKDVFLGAGSRAYTRAADTQKCIRVHGKHNDLDEVGYSRSHHTFFEMLGNWSFGDYFKKEAILWAWELLTEVWSLPKERLYATVFAGDEEDGVPPDNEAADLWTAVTDISENRIMRLGKKDNFWEMGDTGPCGPCSEILIDLNPEPVNPQEFDPEGDGVVEIWNLVFIQFNRKADGSLDPLPAQHVDTGMGFERLCAILQKKPSNYETDLFAPLIERVSELSGHAYDSGKDGAPMRVIADHARMLTFAVADGALPSNDGRGYVLRRVLRRAARYGRSLGMEEPFIHRLTPVLAEMMGGEFPEIAERQTHIERVIRAEEESFGRTLDRGIERFEEAAQKSEADGAKTLSGDDAFKLYDTYGFPLDLTQLMAAERGMSVDTDAFNERMSEQRARARASQKFTVDPNAAAVWQTVSEGEESLFVGYDSLEAEARIRRIRLMENASEGGGPVVQLTLDKTPFYAEAGGQVGDRGILNVDGETVKVLDTQRGGDGSIAHTVDRLPENPDGAVLAQADVDWRRSVSRAHSATHLLHAGLRKVLGDHVSQAGSLVAPDRVRFDISHYEAVSADSLREVEAFVNEHALKNYPVETALMNLDAAREAGALALFGEKYDETARTVRMGEVSFELCGGCHVGATAEVGLFKILREQSVAAGVRRVEASAGETAYRQAVAAEALLNAAADAVGARQRSEIVQRIEKAVEKTERLEREMAELRRQSALGNVEEIVSAAQDVGGVKVASGVAPVEDRDALRQLMEAALKRLGDRSVVVLGAEADGKPIFVAGASKTAVEQDGIHAGALIKEVAAVAKGGGGGRPDMAQAGGRDLSKLEEAVEHARKAAARQLSK